MSILHKSLSFIISSTWLLLSANNVYAVEARRWADLDNLGVVFDLDKDLDVSEKCISDRLIEYSPDLRGNINVKRKDIIAWCAKSQLTHRPPEAIEEILICTNMSDSKKWICAYFRNATGNAFENKEGWKLARDIGGDCFKIYDSKPHDEQLSEFIISTNFGNNEIHDSITPLAILFYLEDNNKSFDTLKTGLSKLDKRKRHKAYIDKYAIEAHD